MSRVQTGLLRVRVQSYAVTAFSLHRIGKLDVRIQRSDDLGTSWFWNWNEKDSSRETFLPLLKKQLGDGYQCGLDWGRSSWV